MGVAEMPTAKGDFILMDYTAKIKENNELFDTSLAEEAKKSGHYHEGHLYEPMLVVVGEGWVLKGLDEKLEGQEVEKKIEIEVPPEKGFGPRDPSKIKMLPLRRFKDEKIAPAPGLEVEVDGRHAVIRSVGAGRVQLDFNPPLAGRTLIYEVEVKKILTTPLEKIQALTRRRIPTVDLDKFKFEVDEKQVTVKVPEEAYALEGISLAKRGLAFEVQKFFPTIEEVTFIENYRRKEVKPPKPEEQKPPEGSSPT